MKNKPLLTVLLTLTFFMSVVAPVQAEEPTTQDPTEEETLEDYQPASDDAFVLKLREDPNFSGAWLDTQGTIHLAFKVYPKNDHFDTTTPVIIETGRRASFGELLAAQRSMAVDSYVDERTGELVLEVPSVAAAHAAERSAVQRGLPVPFRLESTAHRTTPQLASGAAKCAPADNCDYFGAGASIEVFTPQKPQGVDCTSGGIIKKNGDYLLVTAAHCGGQNPGSGWVEHNGYIIGDFTYSSWQGSSTLTADVMTFKLRQQEMASRHYNKNSSGGYVDITGWDMSVIVGEAACSNAVNAHVNLSKGWKCEQVTSIAQKKTCGAITQHNYIRVNNLNSGGGDSGSPIWGNGKVRGIFNCYQYDTSTFTGITWSTPPSAAIAKTGGSAHGSYKPHSEIRNRNFDRSSYWSDWRLQGSGQRARYSSGGKDQAWTTEFNCFTSGCSIYQDTPAGSHGYNPGNKFKVEAWVKCNAGSSCNVTLAMWTNPNGGTAHLAGATTTSISAGQWKRVTLTATVPSGGSSNQARWELYNNQTSKNVRFSLPVFSRI